MIIVSRSLLRILTGKFAIAITLYPFIIVRSNDEAGDKILLNHERIHLRQQIELLLIFFYIAYYGEYLFYRSKGLTQHQAYAKISFEREAYAYENKIDYLSHRKWYAQWRK